MKEMADVAGTSEAKAAEEVTITDEFRKTFVIEKTDDEGRRGCFLFSLLVMASYVVLADGKTEESEYQYVSQFLSDNFGPEGQQEGMSVLHKLIEKHSELAATRPMAFLQLIGKCGAEMKAVLSPELRYQLLSMLAMISKSDHDIADKEVEALKDVATYIGLKSSDVDALLSLDPDEAKKDWTL